MVGTKRWLGNVAMVLLCGAVAAGCNNRSATVIAPGSDGGTGSVGGSDGGTTGSDGGTTGTDGGGSDGGTGGSDGGVTDGGTGGSDGGVTDGGGSDGGAADGGTGGSDGGVSDGGVADGGITFGGPGPWPQTNVTYGSANGILEFPVVGMSTDESQNLWVATHAALYLLQPGQTTFRRFAAQDGLHLQSNPATYCDSNLADGDRSCPIYGGASDPGISEIVGGGPNEVFVGYYGSHNWSDPNDGTWADMLRHTGKLDRVRLNSDATLQVDRFDMVSGNSPKFWHNRSVERMIFDHFIHKHELYVGTDHGVDKFSPDLYHPTIPGTWFNGPQNNLEWMSDHLHPQTCYHTQCGTGETGLRLGDWRGLALDKNGDLWVEGRWAAGLISWVADNSVWFNRGGGAYLKAFGDPYYGACSGSRPIWCTPQEGDVIDGSAAAVTPDGMVWFASGAYYNGADDMNYGVASFDGKIFTYYNPVADLGMGEVNVRDMVALPDGRLVFAGPSTGLVFWDPATRKSTSLRAGQGIPDDHVYRLELDQMVSPPALHVSTSGGAATIRVFPR